MAAPRATTRKCGWLVAHSKTIERRPRLWTTDSTPCLVRGGFERGCISGSKDQRHSTKSPGGVQDAERPTARSPCGAGGYGCPTTGAPGMSLPGDEISDTAAATSTTRRASLAIQLRKMVVAINAGDDKSVEASIVALSKRSRLLAPLALAVGAFVMLFQGVKLLFKNWRLTLVQVLPAMWIWAAMIDLKAHALHGKAFHVLRGPLLIPLLLLIASITAASFFLNAVFAFAISSGGKPEIRPAFGQARHHARTVLLWGYTIGFALGFATVVVDRWGKFWFSLTLSIVVAIMMVAYVSVPARLIGVKSEHSTRDKLTATAIGGALGATVCSPPFILGRFAILLLGSHTFRVLAVVLLIIAVVLQTGANSAVKAIKMSAKLSVGAVRADEPHETGERPVDPREG